MERYSASQPRSPHVVGMFSTREQAERALDALLAEGFLSDSVSVVSAEGKEVSFPSPAEERRDASVRDVGIGATLGGIAGLLIAGPLLVLAGAVVGGLIGLLTALGATRQQAEYLTEQVRSGRYLVFVNTAEREAQAVATLENAGASEVHRLVAGHLT